MEIRDPIEQKKGVREGEGEGPEAQMGWVFFSFSYGGGMEGLNINGIWRLLGDQNTLQSLRYWSTV